MDNLSLSFLVLVVAQALDVFSTVRALKAGGHEANPVMAWVFARVGVPVGFAVTKAALLAAAYYAQSLEINIGLTIVYAAVVVNNLRVAK